MKLSEFDFTLPEQLIAQRPLPERDQARMMVVHKETGDREHRLFRELPEILQPRHCLVLNNTKVIPARIIGHRVGRTEEIEILLAREETPGRWIALLKPARKAPPGAELMLGNLQATVLEARADGSRVLGFAAHENVIQTMEALGTTPLPPYIRRQREDSFEDRTRYQTVYARHPGSIAAPTAGLHFTPEVLHGLERRGVPIGEILLHVGYGTFQPVRCEQIEDHRMEPEYFEVTQEVARRIRGWKSEARRIVAVGTTSTRVLEHLAQNGDFPAQGSSGMCSLFIYPGYEFRVVDGLLTNFHLPRSTLLMLVSAFLGRDLILECYREAISERYRFFSYGDCMLIL